MNHPHRRYNLLLGSWVLCSPQRLLRPWEGQQESSSFQQTGNEPTHDPTCKLCPRNQRAKGEKNDDYQSTFVFNNDFSAIFPPGTNLEVGPFSEPATNSSESKKIFIAENADGFCKVICFSPLHTKTLPELEIKEIRNVVDIWATEYTALSELPYLKYALFFRK